MATHGQKRQTTPEAPKKISPEFPSTYYVVPIGVAHRRALDRYNAERDAMRSAKR